MDMRTKIATENWTFCKAHLTHLNDWETQFIMSVNPSVKLTSKQFNKLSSITSDLGKKVFSERNEL